MNSRRSTPRSRVEEIKALRVSKSKLKPTTSKFKGTRGLAMTNRLNSIINSGDTSINSTIVISKPSVPLLPMSRLSNFVSPRERKSSFRSDGSTVTLNSSQVLNTSTGLNSSLRRIPQPPTSEKPRENQRKKNFLTPQQQFEKLTLPISGIQALKIFQNSLTSYQQAEVLDYKQVYYLGFNTAKAETTNGNNHGFDDDKNNYRLFKHEHIAFRYQVIKMLGKGSFGQVCECMDHKTKEPVALKIIKNHKRFRHQAGVQVKVLKAVRENDQNDTNNMIKLQEYFVFRKHVCLTFELLSQSLYDLLKNNSFKGFSLGLIRRFAIQLLVGLNYTNRLEIIHCDLKPQNILLKQANKSGIKIIDFGSACFYQERVYTYIQSRFYRAPEIILGIPYTTAIDMWSFGCILAELFSGVPLLPGQSQAEQLKLMIQLLGVPSKQVLQISSRKSLFFNGDTPKQAVKNLKSIQEVIKSKDQNFIDLIEKCLEWDPEKRIKAEQALRHPWIVDGLFKPEDSKRRRSSRRNLQVNQNNRN